MKVQLRVPELHPAQMQIKNEARRFNVLDCGRRFGKDILGHELLITPALEGLPVAWFAPTYRMMLDTFGEVAQLLRPLALKVNASEHRIELLTHGIIDMWSLDSPDIARGRKYKRVIVNEAAIIPGLKNAWDAVIRPTLADYEGDGFFLSTPKGRNAFWSFYQMATDGLHSDWQGWHYPTNANPFIKSSEIDAMREQMPERTYRQEILAEFLENQGSIFRNVREVCNIVNPDEPSQHLNHKKVMGVDWAKSYDFTRLRIGCAECHRIVDWDGFNQIDFHFQRERLKTLADRWQVDHILAEANSIGEPNIEELQREGLPVQGFETTATSKPPLIESLALAIERNEWQFPQEDADELESYEMKISSNTGRPTYSAPEGGHDDRVIADALVVHLAHQPTWYVAEI